MLDNTIHFIDLLITWFGAVTEVKAECDRLFVSEGDVDDTAFMLMRHETGVMSFIGASWLWWGNYRYEIEVVGEEGIIKVVDGDKVEFYKKSTREKITPDTSLPEGQPDGCEANYVGFMKSVIDGTEPPVPGKAGFASLEVALASYKACSEKRDVLLR